MTGEFSLFHRTKLEWDASRIESRTDGRWTVFLDGKTGEILSSPRRSLPNRKIPYKHKRPPKSPPVPELNPLVNPPYNNYKEFRARKTLSLNNSVISSTDYEDETDDCEVSRELDKKRKVIVYARNVDPPQNFNERMFFGDDPLSKNRFIRSADRVKEMRREEEIQKLVQIRIERDKSRSVIGSRPSLFERSLTPKEKNYCWPRDFKRFSPE